MDKYNSEKFVPKKIDFIDKMIMNRFHAIRLKKSDTRIGHLMDDPFLPPYNTICGIYCIYRKSILEVLSGKITSFNSYEFKTNFSSDKLIEEEDFEDVLDFAIFVVISSEDSEYISHYFIGGDSERLNSILNICLGYPQAENQKILNNTLKHFNKDIVAVENMEYLDNILNEHP